MDAASPARPGMAVLATQLSSPGSISVSYTHLDVYKRQPSSILGLMYLTHILHPDLYTAEQYQAEAESFYRDFFGIEVSADDIGL